MFLALPCPCGWCFTQMNEADTDRLCERCGRHMVFDKGFWTQVTPKDQIKDPIKKGQTEGK